MYCDVDVERMNHVSYNILDQWTVDHMKSGPALISVAQTVVGSGGLPSPL